METYSSDVSYLIRQDFLRFSIDNRRTTKGETLQKKLRRKKRLAADIEALRQEMTHDDGRGSFGQYKCPIF